MGHARVLGTDTPFSLQKRQERDVRKKMLAEKAKRADQLKLLEAIEVSSSQAPLLTTFLSSLTPSSMTVFSHSFLDDCLLSLLP